MDPRRLFGNRGENAVAGFLIDLGYTMLARQYRTRGGEIDLICQDGNEVVFVEVKSRRSSVFGYPEQSVTSTKIGRMLRASERYFQEQKMGDVPWRFDVVAVEYEQDPPKITHFIGIDIPERFW
ncbi:MAG: YraN family protein [bacterium]|jgi:putative endonuclease|nr:YraN family protein [bacterium]